MGEGGGEGRREGGREKEREREREMGGGVWIQYACRCMTA